MSISPSTRTNQRLLRAEATGRFKSRNGQTIMYDRYAKAPLKWSHSFPDGNHGGISVYLQDVSPGWMDGDHYQVDLMLEPDSKATIRTTTYGKIHPARTQAGGTNLKQRITVDRARLVFCPEPVIPFADAKFEAETSIQLIGDAQLFWSECWAPGRVHKGEQFQYDSIHAQTEILLDRQLLVWDSFRFEPSKHPASNLGAWETYSHCGSIWYIDPARSFDEMERLLAYIAEIHTNEYKNGKLRLAASRLDGPGISIRLVANDAASIQHATRLLLQYVRSHFWEEHDHVWTAPGESIIS